MYMEIDGRLIRAPRCGEKAPLVSVGLGLRMTGIDRNTLEGLNREQQGPCLKRASPDDLLTLSGEALFERSTKRFWPG
jgi:hypothetical protein